MKTFTFVSGRLDEGIALISDEKLGKVIFLGESGRGRRYEKVALSRNNPAEVVGEKVLEAHPVKITINKGSGQERSFFVLERPKGNGDHRLLVRVNTQHCYTRNSVGNWKAIKGNPTEVVRGYGARGDAGRIGSWDDGLVIMSPGDVFYVKPEGGHKTKPFALFYDSEKGLQVMPYTDYENITAVGVGTNIGDVITEAL